MQTGFRLAALAVAFVSLVFWLFGGPNLGRTGNPVPRGEPNPVSGVAGPVVDRRFVPGVDFLAGAGLLSGALFAVSYLLRDRN